MNLDRRSILPGSDGSPGKCPWARRSALAALVMTATVVLAACAGTGATPSASSAPTAKAASSHPNADARAHSSTDFVVPFDVTPPSWLEPKPLIEQPHFVTWEAPDLPAVRVLAPVNVYRPGQPTDTAVPSDYLPYLLAQSDHGAHFSDQTTTTVGGNPRRS